MISHRRYTGKLSVVCDNFSPHKRTEVIQWCADNNVELVFTPTNASWLNWIEAEFAALRYFTLNGSDHATQEHTISRYTRWPDQSARPKRNFAIGSKTPLPTQNRLTRH